MIFFQLVLIWLYSVCLFFIFLYSLSQLHLTWLYLKTQKNTPAKPGNNVDYNWPAVTIQLPVYNEMYVVDRLLDAIMAIDYPPHKLQVQVLDDSTDETRNIISQKVKFYQSQNRDITQVHRPNRQGYKAGALQVGLTQATGEFIAIFDADFLPSPSFLKDTIPSFTTDNIGVVQTRWGHLNQDYSLLTRLQAFGLNAHFTIEQTGRNSGHHFINFNGTAGIWRKTCIEDAGGWQADTLTEDLDLSYRAQLRNWQFIYLENAVTPAELPATMPAVKSQQFRWMKGAAENAVKNLGNVFRSSVPFNTKVHAFFHLLNSSVFIAIILSAVLSIPILYLKQKPDLGPYFLNVGGLFLLSGAGLVTFYWVSYQKTQAADKKAILLFIPQFILFLAVSMGLSLHNSLAVTEGYLGIKTPFIRTPKFNLRHAKDTWQHTRYVSKSIFVLVILEGLLSLYFLFGLYAAWYLQDYGMIPFHAMLSFGFGVVCYYSVKHSR